MTMQVVEVIINDLKKKINKSTNHNDYNNNALLTNTIKKGKHTKIIIWLSIFMRKIEIDTIIIGKIIRDRKRERKIKITGHNSVYNN
jgi:hypothetical protein